jgi:hypothetical protein
MEFVRKREIYFNGGNIRTSKLQLPRHAFVMFIYYLFKTLAVAYPS